MVPCAAAAAAAAAAGAAGGGAGAALRESVCVRQCLQGLAGAVPGVWQRAGARTEVRRLHTALGRALGVLPGSTAGAWARAGQQQQQPLFCVFVCAPGAEPRRDGVLARVLAELGAESASAVPAVLRAGLPFERSPEALVAELLRQAQALLPQKQHQQQVPGGPTATTAAAAAEEARAALERAVAELQKHRAVVLVCDGIEGFCDTPVPGIGGQLRGGGRAALGATEVENSGGQYLQKHSIPSLLADLIAAPGARRIACVATSTVLDVAGMFPDRVRSRDVKTLFLRPCTLAEAKAGVLACLTFPPDAAAPPDPVCQAYRARWNEAAARVAGPAALDRLDAVVNTLSNDPECVPRLVDTVIATIAADVLDAEKPLECVVSTAVLQECALRYCTFLYVHRHVAAELSETEATVLVGLYYLSTLPSSSSSSSSASRTVTGPVQQQQQQSLTPSMPTRSLSDRLLELFRTSGAASLPTQLKTTAGITAVLERLLANGFAIPLFGRNFRKTRSADDCARVAAEGLVPIVCTLAPAELAGVAVQLAKERRCGSLLNALMQLLPPLALLS